MNVCTSPPFITKKIFVSYLEEHGIRMCCCLQPQVQTHLFKEASNQMPCPARYKKWSRYTPGPVFVKAIVAHANRKSAFMKPKGVFKKAHQHYFNIILQSMPMFHYMWSLALMDWDYCMNISFHMNTTSPSHYIPPISKDIL